MFFTATVRHSGEREKSFPCSPFLKEEIFGVQRNLNFLNVFRRRSSLWDVYEWGSVIVIGFIFEVSQIGVSQQSGRRECDKR